MRDSKVQSTFEQNRQLLIFDFPQIYLEQVEQVLYPDWYVACFMKDYRNSSVWSHYGDHHKGVCLIFQAEMAEGATRLPLEKNYRLFEQWRALEFFPDDFL